MLTPYIWIRQQIEGIEVNRALKVGGGRRGMAKFLACVIAGSIGFASGCRTGNRVGPKGRRR